MENFLYITSHDLRTPLVNIQGFTQNLERCLGELKRELSSARLPQPLEQWFPLMSRTGSSTCMSGVQSVKSGR